MEISTKNTKAELLDYIKAQQQKIKEYEAHKNDAKAVMKAKEESQLCRDAEELATETVCRNVKNLMDDFNGFVNAFNDLQAAISLKKRDLEELYDIEQELMDMQIVHNARIDCEADCKEETASLKRVKDAELKRITADFEEKKAILEKEYKDKQKELDTIRKRSEDEYQYNLLKAHREQKDALEAELKSKRKETDDYCAEMNTKITKQLNDLEEMATNLAVRESNMEEIEEHAKVAEEQGYAKGKAEAGKEWSFEKRAIEAKHEKEEALLKADLKAAEKTIKDLEGRVKELNEQLAEARKNHQALAEKSIEAGAKSAPVFMPMGNYNEPVQGGRK